MLLKLAVFSVLLIGVISDSVWLAIIGVVAMIVKEYFDRQRNKDTVEKVDRVVKKTDEVAIATVEVKDTVAEVKKDVAAVVLHTNSMKDALVHITEKEAHARGTLEERDRAEVKKEDRVAVKKEEEKDLKQAVAEVPEKTAVKVVDRLKDK